MLRSLAPHRFPRLRPLAGTVLALNVIACVFPSITAGQAPTPIFPEAAEVMGRGTGEIDGVTSLGRSGETRSASIGEIAARIGLASRLELRANIAPLSVSYTSRDIAVHSEDAVVGLKTLLRRGNEASPLAPEIGLTIESSVPWTPPHTIGVLQPSTTLTVAWHTTPRTIVSTAASLSAQGTTLQNVGHSLMLGYNVIGNAVPYASAENDWDTHRRLTTQSASAGVSLGVGGAVMDVHASATRGLEGREQRVYVGVGRQW